MEGTVTETDETRRRRSEASRKAAAAKLARAEAYLRDALLAEATLTGRAPPLVVADTAGRLLA